MAKKTLQCSPLNKDEVEERILAGEDPSLYFIEVELDDSEPVVKKGKKE